MREMIETTTYDSIFNGLEINPTVSQSKALYQIEEFLEDSEQEVFVLRGSAGTGKTTITKVVVDYLKRQGACFYLLAPTGKAASILKEKTDYGAHTIHHLIYIPNSLDDGRVYFEFKENTSNVKTVYIVDESSMISSEKPSSGDFISNRPLLDDFITFVKQGNPENKILFLGDNYQLKPVKESESVAISAESLQRKYNLKTQQLTLNEVVRQAEDSPVLELALQIKKAKDYGSRIYDIRPPRLFGSNEALNYYLTYFDRDKLDEITLISKTNDHVLEWNQRIRKALGLSNKILSVGDVVMLRTTWMNGEDTIVNGEIGIVELLIGGVEELEGFQFQDAKIKFIQGGTEKRIKTKIILDLLESSYGQLDRDCIKMLKHNRMKHNPVYRQSKIAKDDSYMNAMKLSYGYAMTCHKAQGSEWKRILYNSQKLHPADHEWLYTAVTRAKEEVKTWRF